MSGWHTALNIFHVVSYVVLVGGLAWMIIVERWARPEGWRALATVDRAFRSTSTLMSVALASVIFSGLGLFYLTYGAFTWAGESPITSGHVIKLGVFALFWVHWGWTEVVSLDGLRKHTPPPEAAAPVPEYKKAHQTAWRSLSLLLAESVVVLALGASTHVFS